MKFKKPKGLVSSFRLACEQLKEARGETFQMYVGPLPNPSHLFHFSSLTGIKAILKSRALWASDARLMPDKTELTYSASVLRESATRTGYYFVLHLKASDLVGQSTEARGAMSSKPMAGRH